MGMENLDETIEEIPSISDYYEAIDFIHDRMESGEFPIVTVPVEYKEALEAGLAPRTSWEPDNEVIAGTIGRKPYLPNGSERIVVEVRTNPEKVLPRMTGPDNAFHGVVLLQGPISRNEIVVH